MRNLVIGIEYILFIIFIVYIGHGIFIVSEIENNLWLKVNTMLFFIALFWGAIYLAYRSIRATKKMFEGITDTPIAFLRKKIKQDKSFILLIFLAVIEVLMTLFWLIVVSWLVYFVFIMLFDEGSLTWADVIIALAWFALFFTPYLVFLFVSYINFSNILKILKCDSIINADIQNLSTIVLSKMVLIFMGYAIIH